MRNARVAAAIELDVFGNCIGQAEIHGTDPIRPAFRADAAEKFKIALEFSDKRASECHRVHKLLVVRAAHFVPQEADAGLHSHVEFGRQLGRERKKRAAFDGIVSELIAVYGKFHEWKKSKRCWAAVVAPD